MQKNFEKYWGIDISKEWLDIAIDAEVFRIAQTKKAIENFLKKHSLNPGQTLVTLESTGGYERLARECLSARGFVVHVAHPNKVVAFAKAKGRLAKTDKIDARLLAQYGQFIELSDIRELPSKPQVELHLLGSRLEQLKEIHHQEICRLGIASDKAIKKSHEMLLKIVRKQIMALENQILTIIKSDVLLKEKYDILRSMKGVGPVLATVLLTHLPELGKANKKEIAALVGVAPITNQSGKKTGKAMTKHGRQSVRKVLYMAALTACRYNVKFKIFYERLVAAGKSKKVAIVAVMRKMIVVLNVMLLSKTAFNN